MPHSAADQRPSGARLKGNGARTPKKPRDVGRCRPEVEPEVGRGVGQMRSPAFAKTGHRDPPPPPPEVQQHVNPELFGMQLYGAYNQGFIGGVLHRRLQGK